jgi:putrescine aminotransferase
VVREVRGAGLMLGIEFDSAATAGTFEIELIARRVVPNHCLNHHEVVRLTPPVCLGDDDVDWLASSVEAAAAAVIASRRKRAATKGERE